MTNMNRQNSAVIGAAVRSRRRALHLTQAELADLAECSERAIRDLERGGGSPRLDTLLAILGAIGLGLQVVNSRGEPVVADGL